MEPEGSLPCSQEPTIAPLSLCDSGLRGLEVTFPPHDPSDAGSNPTEVVEFLRTEKFREQVADLLHVKEPHVPRGPLSKIADISRPS
jgi:hypothetical protein